jgi:hypothetical protein
MLQILVQSIISYSLYGFYKIKNEFLQVDIEGLKEQVKKNLNPIIREIVNSIDVMNWDRARELWIIETIEYKNAVVANHISLFGSEDSRFLKYLRHRQIHQLRQVCINECIYNKNLILSDNSTDIYFIKKQDIIALYSAYTSKCRECKMEIECEIKFRYEPVFLIIESYRNDVFFHKVPKQITIDSKDFRLLCMTVLDRKINETSNHFMGVFFINDKLYAVNDIGRTVNELSTMDCIDNYKRKREDNRLSLFYSKYSVTTSLYVLS